LTKTDKLKKEILDKNHRKELLKEFNKRRIKHLLYYLLYNSIYLLGAFLYLGIIYLVCIPIVSFFKWIKTEFGSLISFISVVLFVIFLAPFIIYPLFKIGKIPKDFGKRGQENYEKLIDIRDELFALDGTPSTGSEKGYRIFPKF
jgi:hypothetical protein